MVALGRQELSNLIQCRMKNQLGWDHVAVQASFSSHLLVGGRGVMSRWCHAFWCPHSKNPGYRAECNGVLMFMKMVEKYRDWIGLELGYWDFPPSPLKGGQSLLASHTVFIVHTSLCRPSFLNTCITHGIQAWSRRGLLSNSKHCKLTWAGKERQKQTSQQSDYSAIQLWIVGVTNV